MVRIRRSKPLAQGSGSILGSGSGSVLYGPDPQIQTTDSRIWIYIRIWLQIRDTLVRIRFCRSKPLIQGSGSILGFSSGSVIFWSGSADPNHCSWIQIIIVLLIPDILVRIRRSEPLTQGSGSLLGSGIVSVIFWSGSATRTTYSRICIYVRIWLRICDILVRICRSIRIRLRIRDILVLIRRSESLTQGSIGSGSGSVIFWFGSADPNH
jgi:hypothetical protein